MTGARHDPPLDRMAAAGLGRQADRDGGEDSAGWALTEREPRQARGLQRELRAGRSVVRLFSPRWRRRGFLLGNTRRAAAFGKAHHQISYLAPSPPRRGSFLTLVLSAPSLVSGGITNSTGKLPNDGAVDRDCGLARHGRVYRRDRR